RLVERRWSSAGNSASSVPMSNAPPGMATTSGRGDAGRAVGAAHPKAPDAARRTEVILMAAGGRVLAVGGGVGLHALLHGAGRARGAVDRVGLTVVRAVNQRVPVAGGFALLVRGARPLDVLAGQAVGVRAAGLGEHLVLGRQLVVVIVVAAATA